MISSCASLRPKAGGRADQLWHFDVTAVRKRASAAEGRAEAAAQTRMLLVGSRAALCADSHGSAGLRWDVHWVDAVDAATNIAADSIQVQELRPSADPTPSGHCG